MIMWVESIEVGFCKQLVERYFFKGMDAQQLQSSVQGAGQFEFLVNDGHHQVNAQRNPDLGFRVVACHLNDGEGVAERLCHDRQSGGERVVSNLKRLDLVLPVSLRAYSPARSAVVGLAM